MGGRPIVVVFVRDLLKNCIYFTRNLHIFVQEFSNQNMCITHSCLHIIENRVGLAHLVNILILSIYIFETTRHDLSVAVLVVSVLAILLLMLTHLVVTDSLLGSVVVLHLDVDLVVLQPLLQLLEGVQVTLNRDGSVLRTCSRKR